MIQSSFTYEARTCEDADATASSPIVAHKLISHRDPLFGWFIKQAVAIAPAELVVDVARLSGVTA